MLIASLFPLLATSAALVSMRLTDSPVRRPEFFKSACEVHAKYRGAFDEVWYGGGKPLCRIGVCRDDLRKMAKLRPWVERAGMVLSFQQGLTLGHDYKYVGTANGPTAAGVYSPEEAESFPDDAWMVGKDGVPMTGRCLCPRSPAVLDYAARYVKAVLEELRPPSYWLDDDLRLGVNRAACFCDRCVRQFGEMVGRTFSREELVRRLFEGDDVDPLRLEWIRFNEETLAGYGRAVRQAADEVMPDCRLSLQTVSSECLLNGRDYGPVLRALSANGRVPAGIRPGHGSYNGMRPDLLVRKAFWCAREAERSRRLGAACGTVCYEEETYPRYLLSKTPGAIVTECALALASGCDALSLYWTDGEDPERIEDYERFVKAIAEARPYFARMAAVSRRTSLGGVARHPGAHPFERRGFTLGDESDQTLIWSGIPVTVAESGCKVWRIADRTVASTDDVAVLDVGSRCPPETQRTRWLDELDRASGGRFPVRIDRPVSLDVLPRVNAEGRVEAVTFLNLSIGETEPTKVRVRRPAGSRAEWQKPRQAAMAAGTCAGSLADEVVVTLPRLSGWEIVTLFFADAQEYPYDRRGVCTDAQERVPPEGCAGGSRSRATEVRSDAQERVPPGGEDALAGRAPARPNVATECKGEP